MSSSSTSLKRRSLLAAAGAATVLAPLRPVLAQAPSSRLPPLRAPRLRAGDTIGLINPSAPVFNRQPYEMAHEALGAMGFKVREGAHLRERRGHLAGTDAQRAADVNAFFADDGVQALWAVGGGSGGTRILPLIDYELVRRKPKVVCGYSDMTALLNGLHARTGLITFHAPFAGSEWNEFDLHHWRAMVRYGEAITLRNQAERGDALVGREGRIRTLRPGLARGPLVGGNLAVLASLVGSPYMPATEGAVLFIEETNEYLYRIDRMLATLRNAGVFKGLAAVVVGACTQCTPGENHGALALDDILDDHLLPLGVPVFTGAQFGHIRRKYTLPVGQEVEVDASAGSLRLLGAAVG